VITHGPGHHLGSDGIDLAGREFLRPLSNLINRGQPNLIKYETVLHLLKKRPLSRDVPIWQIADLLIKLPNELTPYKSYWRSEMEQWMFLKSLRTLNRVRPPWVSESSNFFPEQCLSAECASWAVGAAIMFLGDFYANLGITSPLTAHR
jgi:hypothetical protein